MKLSSIASINEFAIQAQGRTTNASSQKISHLSYNFINTLSKARIMQIKKEAELMLGAPQRFQKIWTSIRNTDLVTGGTPNLNIFQSIFEDHKKSFEEILRIQTAADLFEVFDSNNNGELNEDEQVLIFSVVKEKMQKAADELLKIQEYELFKNLMEKIRMFEKTITNYQNELRQNIYKEQLNIYHEIGNNKLNEFYDKFDQLFKEFNHKSKEKLHELDKKHSEELEKNKQKNDQPIEILKVKPNNKIKQMKDQEKLLSIVERVPEAYKIHKELKESEAKEREIVEQKLEKKASLQEKNLKEKQEQEKKILNTKIQEKQNKLILQMRKEFNILQKKIHIHEREIQRIQSLVSKYAIFRGSFLGELIREKTRSKQQNDIMESAKRVQSAKISTTKSPDILKINEKKAENELDVRNAFSNINSPANRFKRSSQMGHSISKLNNLLFSNQSQRVANINKLKKTIESKSVVKFYLKEKFGEDKPINYVFDKGSQGNTSFKLKKHEEIEKFLKERKIKKRDVIPKLSELYNEELMPLSINYTPPQTSPMEEKLKRKFLNNYLRDNIP